MTLARFLRDGHAHHPEKTALIFAEHTWTYAEVDTLTDRIATNLLAKGLEPGDRVALHLSNCPELVFSYYGCFKAGAIAVPINARMGPWSLGLGRARRRLAAMVDPNFRNQRRTVS